MDVTDIGKNNCTLTWRPPADDGGSRVTHYIVEKRDISKGKDYWVPYTDHCRVSNFSVKKFLDHENNVYFV